jgi:HSP20 family protein
MALIRTNPWSAAPAARVNRFFENLFPEISERDDMNLMEWLPVVDTYEKDESIVVKAELPGMKKEDISIDVKNNILTISGERKHEEKVEKSDFYRSERFYGRFQRCFTLPDSVDAEQVDASYKDGILEVKIPKTEESSAKKIEIK